MHTGRPEQRARRAGALGRRDGVRRAAHLLAQLRDRYRRHLREQRLAGSGFGAAAPVADLNDPAANDIQPNVRRDGLEVVLSSNRSGTLGGQDVWIATRARICDPWSVPRNIGPAVNTGGNETRPSLSRKGDELLFGRAPGPEGLSDVYLSTRDHPRR